MKTSKNFKDLKEEILSISSFESSIFNLVITATSPTSFMITITWSDSEDSIEVKGNLRKVFKLLSKKYHFKSITGPGNMVGNFDKLYFEAKEEELKFEKEVNNNTSPNLNLLNLSIKKGFLVKLKDGSEGRIIKYSSNKEIYLDTIKTPICKDEIERVLDTSIPDPSVKKDTNYFKKMMIRDFCQENSIDESEFFDSVEFD